MILLTKRVRQYIFCLALLCAGVMTASAATLTVTKIADTSDTVCDADCSLREAIAAAASGDTIVFASPTFDTAQVITLSDAPGFRELIVDKNLTITGRGARLLTVQRSAAATSDFRIFNLGDNTIVNISGMTISGGRAAQGGEVGVISERQIVGDGDRARFFGRQIV